MNKLWESLRLFIWLTFLVGICYPLLVTAISQIIFRQNANGSIVRVGDKIVGSSLIAQKFEDMKYFWPRPSSIDYNPMSSGGSNLGPTSSALKAVVEERMNRIAEVNQVKIDTIPPEILFSSGSGLDPHISLTSAYFQVPRVAKARGMAEEEIKTLIDRSSTSSLYQLFGEAYINVLMMNISLDELGNKSKTHDKE